jgi:hypothetical protein
MLQLIAATRAAAYIVLITRTEWGASICTLFKTTLVLADVTRGDCPAERDERRACRRVCDVEYGSQALEKVQLVKRSIKILSPVEDTPAKQGGGMTSPNLSASWVNHLGQLYLCVAIMDWIFGGRWFVHKLRRKFDGSDGRWVSGGGGGSKPGYCRLCLRPLEAGRRAALQRVTGV